MKSVIRVAVGSSLVSLLLAISSPAQAAVIYASGQLLIPGDPGVPAGQPGHDDARENYIFSIDSHSGVATSVSPNVSGLPAALGATADGRLWGFSGNTLRTVNPLTGATSAGGSATPFNATGFDVTAAGVGYGVTNGNDQLFSVDLTTGNAAAIGAPGLVNAALAAAGAVDPDAFIISLGSVGSSLYGIDLSTDSLLQIDPSAATASVVGALGAVDGVGAGIFSGYAGLTGVDENADGQYDALFGAVNFIDPDGPAGSLRLGGIARFDLTDGSWDLVGLNEGVIFFGVASPPAIVPEPTAMASSLLAVVPAAWSRRRARAGRGKALLA